MVDMRGRYADNLKKTSDKPKAVTGKFKCWGFLVQISKIERGIK